MQEQLAILLSRQLSGEATPEELQELEAWIRNHPQDHYLIEMLQTYWSGQAAGEVEAVTDNAHFDRILNKAKSADATVSGTLSNSKAGIRRRLLWWAAAAVFFAILLTAILFEERITGKSPRDHQVATVGGMRSHVILPDGTAVWLNARSSLHYDKSFNKQLREVYLEGEAFFEVKKDQKRPFIVHTSDIDIRVLGTAFNVKSYGEEDKIEATLVHGSIQVTAPSGDDIGTVQLRPNEKLVFKKQTKKAAFSTAKSGVKPPVYRIEPVLLKAADSSFIETSWIHNKLLFDGDSFAELAVKMERWFDVKITFTDTAVANYRLRGVFEDESVTDALQALQQIAQFNYTINDRSITISKKNR